MEFRKNVSLALYNTFHIDTVAEFFVTADSPEALVHAFWLAERQGLTARVLGGGSNVLLPDGVLPGLTIRMAIQGYEAIPKGDDVIVRVAAGELFDDVVERTVREGLWGLENLSAIPGLMGATPIQNVGAYGVEISSLIQSVRGYDRETKMAFELSKEECAFGYRHSRFKEPGGKRYIIEEVDLLLSSTPRRMLAYRDLALHFEGRGEETITQAEIRAAVVAIRARKFPDWHVEGTAGSFFKNPVIVQETFNVLKVQYPDLPGYQHANGSVKLPLGWIIDHVCNMRGVRDGNVGTYAAQSLVIVNYGGATAHEVSEFAKKIEMCVKEKTNIDIEREVTIFT